MAKQSVTTDDGKVLIVDTDKGTYTEAQKESEERGWGELLIAVATGGLSTLVDGK